MPRHVSPKPGPDGWTDWVSPNMRGYRLACCDCGLVHNVKWRVLRVTRYTGKGGFQGVLATGMRVQMRVSRNERATSQVRRHKRPPTEPSQ